MSDINPPAVVIVDDEEMVLTSISSFLTLETDYQVETYTNGKYALDFIERNNVGLIISDYLMPEMDGIAFLSRARKLKPEIPRIILTGYADKENAIKAINNIGLFQYIEKPWDNNDLLIIIRNGLEKFQLTVKLQSKMAEINKAYGDIQQIQNEIVRTFV
jgi:DNA-binding NtrC family response regulator